MPNRMREAGMSYGEGGSKSKSKKTMRGYEYMTGGSHNIRGGMIEDPLTKAGMGMSMDPNKPKVARMGMNDRVEVNTPQYKGTAPGMIRTASKGLEALAKANPELTYKKVRKGYEY